MLAALTGGEVVCHARGGARLSEQLNPNTRLAPAPRPRWPGSGGTMWCSRR